MKTILKKEVYKIENEFKDVIENLTYIPISIRNEISKIFSIYTPFKERAYFFKLILEFFNVDSLWSRMFYLGIEAAFVSYYVKDDIVDNTKGRALGYSNKFDSCNTFLLYSDILLEVSHGLINSFSENFGKKISVQCFHKALLQLSLGQLLSLNKDINKYPTPTELANICYLKSGALYESGVSMLSYFINDSQNIQILKSISISLGIGSQIRNDIEDFIISPVDSNDDSILEDISNGQANYVLSHFFNDNPSKIELLEISKYYNKNNYSKVENQDTIIEILESKKSISKSILDLNELKQRINEELYSLLNNDLADVLTKYANNILSIHPKLNI